ncbi:MAG TPA: hypothetical protein PLQ41_02910 [bacterium]|nr:hypothetical protein [bacterium]HPP29982.1 hypothetical protein [bacterium]
MKFNEFLGLYAQLPFIDSRSFNKFDNPSHIRRQVNYWLKKGYLIKLKKGFYIFSEPFSRTKVSPFVLANYMVSPSYISLETALNYYNLIPEKITSYTSITTKKTGSIKNPLGIFSYFHIKIELFYGFTKKQDNKFDFFIASPEKAVLDYFYFKGIPSDYDAFEEIRFQNLEVLNLKNLDEFSNVYNQKVRNTAIKFIEYCKMVTGKYQKL